MSPEYSDLYLEIGQLLDDYAPPEWACVRCHAEFGEGWVDFGTYWKPDETTEFISYEIGNADSWRFGGLLNALHAQILEISDDKPNDMVFELNAEGEFNVDFKYIDFEEE